MWRRVDLVWTDVSEERQFKVACSSWFLARGFLYPEDGGDTFLRNVGLQDIHGATSQKMTFFIITAVKTSNLTLVWGIWETYRGAYFEAKERSVERITKWETFIFQILLPGRANQGERNGQDICALRINEKCAKDPNRKRQGKRPLGRPRKAWKYNFKMDLIEAEVKWFILMSNDRIVWTQQWIFSFCKSQEFRDKLGN
jgi:hypothetical protein